MNLFIDHAHRMKKFKKERAKIQQKRRNITKRFRKRGKRDKLEQNSPFFEPTLI